MNLFLCQRTLVLISNGRLLFLVAVCASTLLALMRRYLVSFTFFTTWHTVYGLVARHGRTNEYLFNFYVSLNSFDKNFCRLECWNVMGWYFDRCVFRDISSSFFCSGLDDKTSKTSQINIFARLQRLFYFTHEGLNSGLNISFF